MSPKQTCTPLEPCKSYSYQISKRSVLLEPHCSKAELGVSGELWRLGVGALMDTERKVKDSIKDLQESDSMVQTYVLFA